MTRAVIVWAAVLVACGPERSVVVEPSPPPRTSAPRRVGDPTNDSARQSVAGACQCETACDCYGVDDPERHARKAAAAGACRRAGTACRCAPCMAP
ncbi:MAG: hypothetical protein R3B36_01015 [Polyangiaceae bacterium]